MVVDCREETPLSAAFFCPQARALQENDLVDLHTYLSSNPFGQSILEEVRNLHTTWEIYVNARDDIRALTEGSRLVSSLQDWALRGASAPVAEARSGIVVLPLLFILQIAQYLCYLEVHGLSHDEFITSVQHAGGLQGYCGGLPSAVAIACASNEAELVKNATIILRVLLGIGAYSTVAEEETETGSTTLALHLKYEGQGDEISRMFPGTYVSAITDPRSISIVGPPSKLIELYEHVRTQGLQVQKMDVRGKVHNPENEKLAGEVSEICSQTPSLQFLDASALRVTVRSNKTGERLKHGSLTEEMVNTILASRCEWFNLLLNVADDLKAACRDTNRFVIFGMHDCVPPLPFHRRQVKIVKTAAKSLIQNRAKHILDKSSPLEPFPFPDGAIAVTGASCRLPAAENLEELWELIANGVDCHREPPADRFVLDEYFRASQCGKSVSDRKFYGNFFNDIRRFDNSFFGINAREAASMDPQQRILLELSHEALESSGYLAKSRRESGDLVGCFIGASFVEYLDNTSSHSPTAYTSTGTIRAFLCGRLSHFYGWTGPSEVIDTACSSSLVAINRACKALHAGECTIALAGGINAITGINNYLDLGKAGFLSPTGQCKPFDESADGYCRSDGGGLVVLKKLQEAILNRDQILGVIPGIATNQGGLSSSLTLPDSTAQKALYRNVLEQAGFEPGQITYVEAHGTGTQAGDPLEMQSIRSIFGSQCRSETLQIGSIKGNIGHCETAAGVAGLLKVLAMIKHGKVPPQANHDRLNSKIPPLKSDRLEITKKLSHWEAPIRAAFVNSYGAAGSNCALICCEMPQQRGHVGVNPSNQSTGIAFPILLSAASRASLLSYARVLSLYLHQSLGSLTMKDISFTLNESRRRHRYCLTAISSSTEDLAWRLTSNELSTFEFSETSKPVVLAFSGQYSNTVSMNRTIYDSYPTFRSYVNACDIELKNLGYESIIPSIFQTQPISDVIILQCSIFAMQYASARSWLDAGLKVSTIIGHSIGELTALAISEALSLSDCIKLIAFRAYLIKTRWGPENGAMLAIQGNLDDFNAFKSQMQSNTPMKGLDVACFNAKSSLVLSGASTFISAAETSLLTNSSLQNLKYQRVDVSHGFHSGLTEPILADLEKMSRSLEWKEPTIPLELCSSEPLKTIQSYSVSRHAREPVFFSKAVRRIEQNLGPCLWIEGGMDTPILRLVKKASDFPEKHTFQAMPVKGVKRPTNVIGEIICQLWRNGIALIHWAFLPTANPECKQVWLPPYQFETTPHWLANIDPKAAQKDLSDSIPGKAVNGLIKPTVQLISRKGVSDQFVINTQSQRYQKIVHGHAVRQRPLCPASMYMECATMAVHIFMDGIENTSISFEELHFQAALGANMRDEVVLQLEEIDSKTSWKFSIRSNGSKPLEHGNGVIRLIHNPMLHRFQRLLGGPIDLLESKPDVERLTSKRAYRLFASVVKYEPFLRGIHTVTLDDWEAIATIALPDDQPHRDESTVWQICDTVMLDTFIQVLGLLMNSSEHVTGEEVMIAARIEHVVILSTCNMDDQSPRKVYTKFGFLKDRQPIGDIIVYNSTGEVEALLSGCHFTKLPISKVERILDSVNTTAAKKPPTATANELSTDSNIATRERLMPISDTASQDNRDNALREMIANYVGMDESNIQHVVLADSGLDSLTSIEVVDELQSRFQLSIASDELMKISMHSLIQRVNASSFNAINGEKMAPTYESGRGHTHSQSLSSNLPEQSTQDLQRLLELLSEVSGARFEEVREQDTLTDIGVDSLSLVDLKQELEDKFSLRLRSDQVHIDSTVKEVLDLLKITETQYAAPTINKVSQQAKILTISSTEREKRLVLPNPFTALKQSESLFTTFASEQGFFRYWSDTAPDQNELLISYLFEAFRTLGVDLADIQPGSHVPQVPHLRKHDRLMQRLWEILEGHKIITIQSESITRGSGQLEIGRPLELHKDFIAKYPKYEAEAKLMALTGTKLAECLTGKIDPVSLMFRGSESLKIMEDFYKHSPMLSTMTEQLVSFLVRLLQNVDTTPELPVHILEVGAGTAGTTKRLAEALEAAHINARYTFTDISPRFVSDSRNKLKRYSWIEYASFNLENEIPDSFRDRFDIVISTNCVHATKNHTNSCRRLRETLKLGGFVVLSEVTSVLDWYDICFGLLDGWWLAERGTVYPLRPVRVWMSTLKAAGFTSVSYSQGPTVEENTQQLLVGCNKQWDTGLPANSTSVLGAGKEYDLETMIYKEVSGVQIHADVYIPRTVYKSPMPIALMIHGGGHMTLSRKDIRPAQTRHLLAKGFLPVSLDHRLCPEVTLVDGPMKDVFDAYNWARSVLPQLLLGQGVVLNTNKVVVIGWSTGGHLAMSIGWNARKVNLPPPSAILSFYAPVDFLSGELDIKRLPALPRRAMTLEQIISTMSTTPITNYNSTSGESSNLGWLCPGDPRSELILSLFKEGLGLPLLVSGLPDSSTTSSSKWFPPPSPAQIALIDPLTQLRCGAYTTPTFIIHGTCDEVAPFVAVERFVSALGAKKVRHGFLPLKGVGHLHDLGLKPGSHDWDEQVAPGYRFLCEAVEKC